MQVVAAAVLAGLTALLIVALRGRGHLAARWRRFCGLRGCLWRGVRRGVYGRTVRVSVIVLVGVRV